jgi:hypothetical protein
MKPAYYPLKKLNSYLVEFNFIGKNCLELNFLNMSGSVKSSLTVNRSLIDLKVQGYVTSVQKHICVSEIVFYVSCKQ